MSYIIAKVAEEIGTITLDDERRRNALSKPLVEQAIAALYSFREAKVRVAIIRPGRGPRYFQRAMMCPSCRNRDGTRWAGMTPCDSSCARSRISRLRSLPWSKGASGAELRRRYLPATSSLPPRPPPSRSRLRSLEYHTMSAECSRCSMPPV